MEGRPIVKTPSAKLLGININNNMSWHDHFVTIAKTASQKLGVLLRCRKLYIIVEILLPCLGLLSEDGDVVVDAFKAIFDEVDEECLKKMPKIIECNDMENFDDCDMEK
nr:unnamed protein product [Callosobruchus analis]